MSGYYDHWRIRGGAPIISMYDLVEAVPQTNYMVCTSGGYDPIHPGHISCMLDSKRFNHVLVVIVNGDSFLTNKKGKPFQNLKTRCQNVSAIRGVDFVVPFEIDGDQTVSRALEIIKPGVFTKGGDRVDRETIPEWETCRKNGIRVMTGVGNPKHWSSSQFLDEWVKFKTK